MVSRETVRSKTENHNRKTEKAIAGNVYQYGDDDDMFNANANGSDIENGDGNAVYIVHFHRKGQICCQYVFQTNAHRHHMQ